MATGASSEGTLSFWDTSSGKELISLEPPVTSPIAFSPKGVSLAVGSGKRLLVYDVERLKKK